MDNLQKEPRLFYTKMQHFENFYFRCIPNGMVEYIDHQQWAEQDQVVVLQDPGQQLME